MAKWAQYTTINGTEKREPIIRTADEMLDIFIQLHFLRQSGEDIEVNRYFTDDHLNAEYTVHRNLDGKTIEQRFVKA